MKMPYVNCFVCVALASFLSFPITLGLSITTTEGTEATEYNITDEAKVPSMVDSVAKVDLPIGTVPSAADKDNKPCIVEDHTSRATQEVESSVTNATGTDDIESTTQYEEYDEDYDQTMEVNATNIYFDSRLVSTTATAATAGQFPYMVFVTANLADGTTRTCSGVILATDYVLTAASCIYDAVTISVRYNSLTPVLTPTPDGTEVTLGTAIVHPKYYTSSHSNSYNVGLVKLNDLNTIPLTSTASVVPVAEKAAAYTNKDFAKKSFFIVSYGPGVSNDLTTRILRYVKMLALTTSQCIRVMKRRNSPKPASHQTCLDTDGDVSSLSKGACGQADVGAPVMYKFENEALYKLVGILTNFSPCPSSTPNMFTHIGSALDWIRQYIPSVGNY